MTGTKLATSVAVETEAGDLEALRERDAMVQTRTAEVTDTRTALAEATTAVTDAVAAWELDQASTALDAALAILTTTIDAASQKQAATENAVADNQVRVDRTPA